MTRILDVAHAAGVKQLVITASIVSLATPAGRRITADTRTNDTAGLGHALLQHHHTGVLLSVASFQAPLQALLLSDPLATTSMPESWVCGAILVRINSLIRGHSAVRWELLEKIVRLLREDITPCVPLRGSISASGGMFWMSCSHFPLLQHHNGQMEKCFSCTGQESPAPFYGEFDSVSDVLGVSALIETLNNPRFGNATEGSFQLPCHRVMLFCFRGKQLLRFLSIVFL